MSSLLQAYDNSYFEKDVIIINNNSTIRQNVSQYMKKDKSLMYATALIPALATMIVSYVSGLTIFLFPLTLVWSILYPFFVLNAYLRISRGEDVKLNALIIDDVPKDGLRFALGSLVSQLLIFAWSLLFFIPGMIKQLSYAMTPYIMQDNPDMKAMDAITESRRMMAGNKRNLLKLYLSYYTGPLILFAIGVTTSSVGIILGLFSGQGGLATALLTISLIATLGFIAWSITSLPRWYLAQALFYEENNSKP